MDVHGRFSIETDMGTLHGKFVVSDANSTQIFLQCCKSELYINCKVGLVIPSFYFIITPENPVNILKSSQLVEVNESSDNLDFVVHQGTENSRKQSNPIDKLGPQECAKLLTQTKLKCPYLTKGLVGLKVNREGEITGELLINMASSDAIDHDRYVVVGKLDEEGTTMTLLQNIDNSPLDEANHPSRGISVKKIEIVEWPGVIPKSEKPLIELNLPKRIPDYSPPTPLYKKAKLENSFFSRSTSVLLDELDLARSPRNFKTPEAPKKSAADAIYGRPPKWPSRLVIIRHGQSEQNEALDLFQHDIQKLTSIRDADIKLTQLGMAQATETGKFLEKYPKFDVCFCSPYRRTIETTRQIVSEFKDKLLCFQDNRLREKEFGRLIGMDEKTVKERFPIEYEARERDGKYWYRFPGGENYPDVEFRVQSFLEFLCSDFCGKSILVVTHQVPYKMFRAVLHHLNEKQVLDLENVHNCGIQEYVLDRSKSSNGRLTLKSFNLIAYNPIQLKKPSHSGEPTPLIQPSDSEKTLKKQGADKDEKTAQVNSSAIDKDEGLSKGMEAEVLTQLDQSQD